MAEWTSTNQKKITVTIFIDGQNICDDKVENRGFLCFKISSVNGVLDIFMDIFKSSNFATFQGYGTECIIFI